MVLKNKIKLEIIPLKRNKKSMFFTLITLSIITLLIISYSVLYAANSRNYVTDRVKAMNNFVSNIDQEIPSQVYSTAYRSIVLLERDITKKGRFLSNINANFSEIFINGTIDNEPQAIMSGSKFIDVEKTLKSRARKIYLNLSIININLSISQNDSWNIKINISFQLKVNDLKNLSFWEANVSKIAYIPIYNFEDPIYSLGTNGLVTNRINKTIYTSFVNGNDVTNLKLHMLSSYYIASPLAPSFLDRLEGKTSPNPNGIESLVNIEELVSQGLQPQLKSNVDYIYFSANNPTSHKISGMHDYFMIDDGHLNTYQVNLLAI